MQRATLTVVALSTLALPAGAQTAGTFVRIGDMTTTRQFSDVHISELRAAIEAVE